MLNSFRPNALKFGVKPKKTRKIAKILPKMFSNSQNLLTFVYVYLKFYVCEQQTLDSDKLRQNTLG